MLFSLISCHPLLGGVRGGLCLLPSPPYSLFPVPCSLLHRQYNESRVATPVLGLIPSAIWQSWLT
jgi:hypothetical protein